MRAIVCQMMTSLNGRIDDPAAFVTGVAPDQYEDIDAAYATFDTIIVGRDPEISAMRPPQLIIIGLNFFGFSFFATNFFGKILVMD